MVEGEAEEGSVRRNNIIVDKPPFKAQAGHSESLVLVVEVDVEIVICGFRKAPRPVLVFTVELLVFDDRVVGFIEKSVFIVFQNEVGHEVLEHCPRPGRQNPETFGQGQGSSKPVPMLEGHLLFDYGKKAGLPCLRRHKVVVAVRQIVVLPVVSNRKQVYLLVVQGSEIRLLDDIVR